MKSSQRLNLESIREHLLARLNRRYRAGDREHGGGDLAGMSMDVLLEEAIDEVIDAIAYLLTLRRVWLMGGKAADGADNLRCAPRA